MKKGLNLSDENSTETISGVLDEETNIQKITPTSEYVLFIQTYTSQMNAQRDLDEIITQLDENMNTKITTNTNGSYTIAIINIDGITNAMALKNKLDNKYPGSYYKKKNK